MINALPTIGKPSVSLAADGGNPLPLLLTDTREKRPLVFTHLPSKRSMLQTGDYSIAGFEDCFSVERKSVPDLINSLTRDRNRFEKELHRLTGIKSCGFARLLIVGTKAELLDELSRRKTTQSVILGSLSAIDSASVPVVWCTTPEKAAAQVERWAVYFYNHKRKQMGMPHKAPDWARSAALDVIN